MTSFWKVVCNAWENSSRRKKVKNPSAYYLSKHNHSQSTIILLNVHTENKIFHIKNRRIEWGRHIKTHIKCCVHMLGNECRTPSVWYEFEWIKAIKKKFHTLFFPFILNVKWKVILFSHYEDLKWKRKRACTMQCNMQFSPSHFLQQIFRVL